MASGFATVEDWLQWEAADRPAAWAGLQEIADVVVRRVARRYNLQQADREDVSADTVWLAVEHECARLRRLAGDVSVPAWMWGVASNLARERGRRRRIVMLCDDDVCAAAADDDSEPGVHAQAAVDVRELLRALTAAQREVEIALLGGLSERATARSLGISRNAVRERMARGRERLRRRIAGGGAGAPLYGPRAPSGCGAS